MIFPCQTTFQSEICSLIKSLGTSVKLTSSGKPKALGSLPQKNLSVLSRSPWKFCDLFFFLAIWFPGFHVYMQRNVLPPWLVPSLPSKHNSQKVPKIPISPKETVATDVNEKDLKSKWCQQLCIFYHLFRLRIYLHNHPPPLSLRYCFTLKLMSGSQDFYCFGWWLLSLQGTVASSFAPDILPTQTQYEPMPFHNVYLFNVQVSASSWSLPKLNPNASLHHCMLTYLHSQVQHSSQQYYMCFLVYPFFRKPDLWSKTETTLRRFHRSTNGSTTSCLESGPSSSQQEGHKHHDDASISGRLYLGM